MDIKQISRFNSRQSISLHAMDEVMWTSSSQHHILLLLMSVFEKRHCQCKHSPKVAQRILKLTTFKAESRELSN